MRISDWSSDVCSSDLQRSAGNGQRKLRRHHPRTAPRRLRTSQPDHLDRRTLQLCPSPGECEGPHSLISSLLVSLLMAGSTPATVPSASSTDEATPPEIQHTSLEPVNDAAAAANTSHTTILTTLKPNQCNTTDANI